MLKGLKNKVKKQAHEEIKKATKDWSDISIDITITERPALLNRQCMYNAMEEYKSKRSVAILEVVSDGGEVAHYLSMDENGKVYDQTLGWTWSGCEYKLSRYIHPDSKQCMGDRLYEFKRELYEMLSASTKRKCKALGLKPRDLF